jgi:hypothetical protein
MARAALGCGRRPIRHHGAPRDGEADGTGMNDARQAPPELLETAIR